MSSKVPRVRKGGVHCGSGSHPQVTAAIPHLHLVPIVELLSIYFRTTVPHYTRTEIVLLEERNAVEGLGPLVLERFVFDVTSRF